MPEPLWQPSAERVAASNLTRFAERVGLAGTDYAALHRFSVEAPDRFWSEVWDFCGVVGERGERALDVGEGMATARFFPGARLNFAENLLRRADGSPALVFGREDGFRRELSWLQLRVMVTKTAAALRASGVGPGDRVAAWLPNFPVAYVLMLATAAIGATFTSTSPDFGARGVLDRFGQVEPKVLVAADGYLYGGKAHDCLPRLREIVAGLPSVSTTVVAPFLAGHGSTQTASGEVDLSGIRGAVSFHEWVAPHDPSAGLPLERYPFDWPLYILYSSGTTGAPKCIVHHAGGVLLKHLEEHQLQCDVRPGDRMFYFTTTGWMMWNWLASGLASEATLVLYDGSPTQPSADVLFELAAETGVTLFGTSAKFIDAVQKAGLRPGEHHDLSALRTITSTGSPLSHESFDYVYEHVKRDVHLASISGGTDICGCFVGGAPTLPVWRGEVQAAMLGMAVDVWDESGAPAPIGESGELVCTEPFPSMPAGFWADPDGTKYREAYFEHFPGVWRHGDWVARTEHGGFVIYGRSDATLNPGGVRIGTAEIYRQVEGVAEVAESIVIGQEWEGDVRVVLFVRLVDGAELSEALVASIKARVRENCTPRHVPAKVLAVGDIPRTRSGKISELAVRDVVHGRPLKNTEALANPEALDSYRDLDALRS